MRPKGTGFTLIELLVVIGIIMILVGLMFPTILQMKESARRTKAKSEIKQIEMAWKAFLSDYRSWKGFSRTAMDSTAVNVLRGNNGTYNPRGLVYMEFGNNALGPQGEMWDPWKTSYWMRIDTTYSNRVLVTTPSNGWVQRMVAVWSSGKKNGSLGTKNDTADDIRGWE